MKYCLQNFRNKFANDFTELSQATIPLGLMTVKVSYSFITVFYFLPLKETFFIYFYYIFDSFPMYVCVL